MPPLRVEAITDSDAFRSLEPIWNAVAARTDTAVPFLSHEWLSTWWECFGAGAQMLVLVVRRGGEPVALAPLMVDRNKRRVSFLANQYSMRANFLLADEPEASLRAIFAHLAGSGLDSRQMVFNYMPEGSTAARLSDLACREYGLRFGFLPSLVSPYVALADTDWDRYLRRLSASFRKNLLYAQRRLLGRESGQVGVYGDPDAVEKALDACREVALTTWQHAHSTSIASSPEVWEFYRRFAHIAAQRGWLRLGILEARGEPVAFEYDLLYQGAMYNLKVGYRPEFRRHSPGQVLKAFMIRQAISEGATEYDMLGMNEDYKMKWATGERRHTCLCVAGPGIGSALRHWLQFVAKPRLGQWRPARALKQWLDARAVRAGVPSQRRLTSR